MSKPTFFQQLQRRNVFKVASIYAVTAWLIIQIVATTFPIFDFPKWSQQWIIILLILGFPIALVWAWVNDDKKEEGPKNRWAVPVSVLIIGLLGVLLLWYRSTNTDQTGQLSNAMKTERVAAIPFENNTGNEGLNAFGSLCSNMITNGLTEAGMKTCSPRAVLQYEHLIGILPNNQDDKISFAEAMDARFRVEGYFLLEGDTITVKSSLVDNFDNEVIRTFPDTRGPITEKEKLVADLTQRIMGYWVNKEVVDRGKITPPLYEAYLEFEKIFHRTKGAWPNARLIKSQCRKAFALDTTFYLAKIEEMFWVADGGLSAMDTIIHQLMPHYDDMTAFEQGCFDANMALYQKDWSKYEVLREKLFQLFPQDPSNDHYAFHLMMRAKKPRKAWEVYNQIDYASYPDAHDSYRANRLGFVCMAGLLAKYYSEVIEYADLYLKDQADPGMYILMKVSASIRNGDFQYIESLLELVKTTPKATAWAFKLNVVTYCNYVARELLTQGELELASRYLKIALDHVANTPEIIVNFQDSLAVAQTHRLSGNHQMAINLSNNLVQRFDTLKVSWFAKGEYISGLGIDHFQLGNMDQVNMVVDHLSTLHSGGWLRLYHLARINGASGNFQGAIDNLTQLKKNGGYSNNPYFYQYDYYMKNLLDYPPYQDFIATQDDPLKH